MSDVPARCSRCGNEINVSEFIAPESLKCSNCGGQLTLDTSKGEGRKKPLTIRKEKPPEATPDQNTPTTSRGNSIFRRKKRPPSRTRRVGKLGVSDYAISWVLVLTLTPILCLLRYVDFLSETDMPDYILGGEIAFAVFYLVIVVEAFTEELFDGILCFFLPPYTFYYLFFKSTSFVLRAIIVALSAAFGWDVCLQLWDWALAAINYVSWWINEGALNG